MKLFEIVLYMIRNFNLHYCMFYCDKKHKKQIFYWEKFRLFKTVKALVIIIKWNKCFYSLYIIIVSIDLFCNTCFMCCFSITMLMQRKISMFLNYLDSLYSRSESRGNKLNIYDLTIRPNSRLEVHTFNKIRVS